MNPSISRAIAAQTGHFDEIETIITQGRHAFSFSGRTTKMGGGGKPPKPPSKKKFYDLKKNYQNLETQEKVIQKYCMLCSVLVNRIDRKRLSKRLSI